MKTGPSVMRAVMVAGLMVMGAAAVEAAEFIVKDGKSNAQIVVAAEGRPRMATLAALELQRGIQQISGARLPIVTTPGTNLPVKIYVGRSQEAEKLGVADAGLKYGAFRMVSGSDWLALVGNDWDFVPSKLTSMKRGDPGPAEEWKKLTAGKTDGAWAFKGGGGFKAYWHPKNFDEVMDEYYGEGSAALWKTGGNAISGFWLHDTAGSVSAVSEFLYGLGVRFYMPNDDLGTVLPKLASIAVPEVNKTVIPDFPCRYWAYYNYFNFPLEEALWARRIGMNDGAGFYSGVHGLNKVHGQKEMQKAHPEYYAIIRGERAFNTDHGRGTPCFSSDGFFKETVNYCRFMFDEMNRQIVDLMPGDGLQQCQCDACQKKTPSEMVWEFINRVAAELYKTHPDHLVNCGAYGSYRVLPDTIEKFSPNVMISIYNYGRATFLDPESWDHYTKNMEKFESKLAPGRIRRGENNLNNGSPSLSRRQLISYPIIFPRAMAKDLVYLKGKSLGEGAECPQIPGRWKAPGVDHLALYIQASFLMNADQDINQVLDEYYTLFYGPAAKEMREAFVYAEDNMATRDKSKSGGRRDITNVAMEPKLRLRELLDKAKAAAGDGIYGQRIAKIISELKTREDVIAGEDKVALNKKRKKSPLIQGANGSNLENAREYSLEDLNTGKAPAHTLTTFKVGWDNKHLIFDIVCKEPDMKHLKASNPIDKGDYVAIALEPPFYDSFYMIYIGSDGKILEGNPKPGNWHSLSEVKIEKGHDFWQVRLSIPIVDAEEGISDPNHCVAGEKPELNGLWYLNVARQRIRGGKAETQALYKGRNAGWNVMESFGKLVIQ